MRIRVVADAERAGLLVAERIAALFERAAATRDRVVLGCPAGRTPRTTYAALASIAARRALDLTRLDLVMMDEYVERRGEGWGACDAQLPHSCARFAEHELRAVLNRGVAPEHALAKARVHFPDPQQPARYEEAIAALGGIDLFLLAAGSSDGHVAFNPPDTPLASETRIVELAESTRRDNLATFPTLGTLARVPTHGVTVGLGTIVRHARAVVLLLLGAEKRFAFERTTQTKTFDPAWPASVIHACAAAEIVADGAAAGENSID